jgi:toxin-antitoxin system PIN domain toxin
MIRLADINLLIALADPNHLHHRAARSWLRSKPGVSLATCALTENGFLRIYGHPSYPGGPGSPSKALEDLHAYRQRKGHCFLPCDLSFDDEIFKDLDRVTPKQLTDLYLVALAARHGVRFASFDASIPVTRVNEGVNAIEVIPP